MPTQHAVKTRTNDESLNNCGNMSKIDKSPVVIMNMTMDRLKILLYLSYNANFFRRR